MKSLRPVLPPDDLSPEQWLVTYDGTPRIVPKWPSSRNLAVVVVYDDPPGTSAAVITSPAELSLAAKFEDPRRLFFTVPRQLLLNEAVCPGLTDQAFYRPAT